MKPTIIRCNKCGYESNIISDTCIKCGSKLEKICGSCGFANAVEKNYCDQCGKLLTLRIIEENNQKENIEIKKENVIGNLEFENFIEAIDRKDISYRNKLSTTNEFDKKKAEETLKEKENLKKYQEQLKNKNEEEAKKLANFNRPKSFFEKNRIYFFLIFFISILFIISYIFLIPNIPKITLIVTAKKYLSALKEKDYKTAYELLSNNSKLSCSFTDYLKNNESYYSKIKKWEFKDLKIHSMTKNGAVIKYLLSEEPNKWKEDYISFIIEGGKWRRPYIWNLFSPIDEAISKGDYPQALFLAQKLYLIDPVDPRTSGYLCTCEYLIGLYDKAIESCKRTLDSLSSYPVGFTDEEIFWYTFYYADSLRFQAKFDEALKIYEELSQFKELSMKNKCPLLIARSDAYVRKGDYKKAREDMSSAINTCLSKINQEEALKRWKYINGQATDEAIKMAKKFYNYKNLDKKEEFELKKSIKILKDNWIAENIDGPEYEVILRKEKIFKNGKKETKDLYKFKVNLWTGDIKIEEEK